MKVMITGHRPSRMKGKTKEIREWVAAMLAQLQPEVAICGMASGVDQIFVEQVLKQHISLAAALPWKRDWEDYHPIVQDMLRQADEVVYAYDSYDKRGYIARDKIMVDAADIVLAVWDGREWGGTWETIKYAREKGRVIIYLFI